MDPINIALSGLNAAQTRIATSANNIANLQSTTSVENGQQVNKPYVPQQVAQQTRETGGVTTSLQDVRPPSVPVFAPDNPAANDEGILQVPNVNLEQEVANQVLASNTYQANLSVIKRANETYESLLDIES